MSSYRPQDMDQMADSVLDLAEAARLLHEEKVDRNKLMDAIEKDFQRIFNNLHVTTYRPSKKERMFNIRLFRQTTEIIAGTDLSEKRAFIGLQNLFFKVYNSYDWRPSLLNELLSAMYRQYLICLFYVMRKVQWIGTTMQLASIATQTDAIKKLQSLFSRQVWDIATDVADSVKSKKRKESKSFDDNNAI